MQTNNFKRDADEEKKIKNMDSLHKLEIPDDPKLRFYEDTATEKKLIQYPTREQFNDKTMTFIVKKKGWICKRKLERLANSQERK